MNPKNFTSLYLIMLFVIHINPLIGTDDQLIKRRIAIAKSIKGWLEAREKQDDAKRNLWKPKQQPKDSPIKIDIDREKRTKKSLKQANENEVHRRKELIALLKHACPDNHSNVFKSTKKLDDAYRSPSQDSPEKSDLLIEKCQNNLKKEIEECSCKQPGFWGKLQNFLSSE